MMNKYRCAIFCPLLLVGIIGFGTTGIMWLNCLEDYYCRYTDYPVATVTDDGCSWSNAQCCENASNTTTTTCICNSLLNRYHCPYSYTVSVLFYISLFTTFISIWALWYFFKHRQCKACKKNDSFVELEVLPQS
jgi:hypothetical protein